MHKFLTLAAVAAAALSLGACTSATRENFADFTHGTGQYANAKAEGCYQDVGPSGDHAHKVPTVRCPYKSDFQGW